MSVAQLVGDSILKRVYHCFKLSFDVKSAHTCVSGLTISELRRLLKSCGGLEPVVVVMIGCNDVMMPGSRLEIIQRDFKTLVRYIRKKCRLVILCEILPFANPKLQYLNQTVNTLNQFLNSFADYHDLIILRLHRDFMLTNTEVDCSAYCSHYQNGRRDGIHPNHVGVSRIHHALVQIVEQHRL